MAYFVAILHMIDPEKNKVTLPHHVDYLNKLAGEGKIYGRGPFTDGSGGLVIYIADYYDEAVRIAERDPHVLQGSRKLELKEWDLLE